MKRLSWKYMAGLIDGEGCIDMQIHRVKGREGLYPRPRLRVYLAKNAGTVLLENMKNNFGGTICTRERAKTNSNWQDVACWQIEGKRMRALLQNIVNHMIIKKEQAKFAIWWLDNMMGKVSTTDEARRTAIDELKAMKTHPQRLSEEAVAKIKTMVCGTQWSSYGNECRGCFSNENPHQCQGYCKKCYNAIYRPILASDAIVHPKTCWGAV